MRKHLVPTLTAAALLPAVLVIGAAPAVAGPGSPGGNNGTIKVSEVGGPEDTSNDPHLSCTFEIQWAGFDAGADLYSDVTFEAWAPTADASFSVTGDTHVFIGEDAAGGAGDHDATEVYTLDFAGTVHPEQGYHVKVTTENGGSRGNDTKFKVFWVEPCGEEGGTEPTEPTTPTPPTTPPTPTTPAGPVTSDPAPVPPVVPWTWDWTYADPTCSALTVDYPANIPDGQANDVNVRFETATGSFTLNFHHNTGTWAGRTIFTFAAHPQWPAGLTAYDVVWVQVGGTNYHWQGRVACGSNAPAPAAPAPAEPAPAAPADPAPADAAPAAPAPAAALEAHVTGFRTAAATVKRGAAPKADLISVSDATADTVQVQQLKKGTWVPTSEATILANGTAKVTFPKLTKKGTYKFRVVVDRTATKPLVVKVR